MAVYTSVTAAELDQFLEGYAVGGLVSHQGIAEGVANTNYFVTTATGEFVLTLFESLDAAELPFFLELTAHLAARGVPCAHPVADRSGRLLGSLCGRPAALVERLPGRSLRRPRAEHCAAAGEVLARMHLAARDFARRRANPFGRGWRRQAAAALAPRLDATDRELLADELAFQEGVDRTRLPEGIVHADLFRDNVLFDGERLAGVIDFYFACTDVLLLDVAVCVNDWCTDAEGSIDPALAAAVLGAYDALRPVTDAERAAWPGQLRAAALRFWLSRLHDRHLPRAAVLAPPRDPDEYRRILRRRRDEGDDTPAHWPRERGA